MSERCEKTTARDVDRPGIIADTKQEAIETRERRSRDFADPVCIHTNQIYSSCRDRDCVTDARVYFSPEDQEIIERAINVKVKSAELIWIYTDIQPVQFNRGYYAVDIKYFVRMSFDVFCGVCNPVQICGLTTFEKRVIMYGAEGNAKVFKSKFDPCEDISEVWEKTNMPEVIVEAVDPIALSAKLVDHEDCCCCCCRESAIPTNICNCMGGELVTDDDVRQVQVSFGLFSIVMLERKVQLLVDAIDFCIPQNECVAATDDNPCDLFNGIRFPINEFFPPQRQNDDDDFTPCRCGGCGCGCNNNNNNNSGCGCGCGCNN